MNGLNIKKEDFLKIKEEDVYFITNPGRMGDEDGSTFIVKEENNYTVYRINGWMYGEKSENYISLNDALKQFPKWADAWEHSNDEEYKGKYTFIYMGFGNGLCVDNRIYDEYKPYLDKRVEEFLERYDVKDQKSMQYGAIFNVWDEAFINMLKDKGRTYNKSSS